MPPRLPRHLNSVSDGSAASTKTTRGNGTRCVRERRFGPRARGLGKAKQGNTSTVPRLQQGVGEEQRGSRVDWIEPELEEFWRPRLFVEAEVVLLGLCGFGPV